MFYICNQEKINCVAMAFGFFDKKIKKGIVTTNLKSVELFSGISYHTLSNWLREGKTVHDNKDHLLFKTETIIKGRQGFKDGK